MNKVLLIVGIVVLTVLGLSILVGIGTYNGLIQLEENVSQQWAEIDNMLQRRADLIPNLVATVRGYASHEEQIFTRVAEARSALLAANSVGDKAAAAGSLNSALGRLLAIAENYPNLKADQSFIRLQDELAGTENRIAVARSRYNESVKSFNARIRRIPGVFFAGFMGLEKRDYFEIRDESVRDVPRVSFE